MLEFTIHNAKQQHTFRHDKGPLVFGRAPKGVGRTFVVEDPYVSRTQLAVEAVANGVRVTNYGTPLMVQGDTLEANASVVAQLPVRISVGATTIEVQPASAPEAAAQGQRVQTIMGTAAARLEATPSAERLADWFSILLSVQQAAAGSAEFYAETAAAIVDLIGLDRGLVLLKDTNGWTTVATHPEGRDQYSTTVLAELERTKQTVFEAPQTGAASLAAVDAFVASPILDANDEVIGALFGARDRRPDRAMPAIAPLEASVVRVLAAAASAGLARMAKQAEAARLRVQFERIFSTELVRELERDPKLLDPADRTITVLFSDLRGFSRLSERIDGASTFALVGEVMDVLTEQVLEERGVIIDYYGDGMAAMWNAPKGYDDHAVRACRAAIAMQRGIAELSARWHERLGGPLAIGVGIHTGPARVGNAGSKLRQKYGPRGHTVNLASRIEGATKYAGVPILVSEATQARLGDAVATRRVGPVRVVGIDDPVALHEIRAEPDAAWPSLKTTYETAVDAFTRRDFARTRELLSALPDADGPKQLLTRNVARAENEPDAPALIRLDAK